MKPVITLSVQKPSEAGSGGTGDAVGTAVVGAKVVGAIVGAAIDDAATTKNPKPPDTVALSALSSAARLSTSWRAMYELFKNTTRTDPFWRMSTRRSTLLNMSKPLSVSSIRESTAASKSASSVVLKFVMLNPRSRAGPAYAVGLLVGVGVGDFDGDPDGAEDVGAKLGMAVVGSMVGRLVGLEVDGDIVG